MSEPRRDDECTTLVDAPLVGQPGDSSRQRHRDEAEMGTGFLDHEALIRASQRLAPWKYFTLEDIWDRAGWKPAYDYI